MQPLHGIATILWVLRIRFWWQLLCISANEQDRNSLLSRDCRSGIGAGGGVALARTNMTGETSAATVALGKTFYAERCATCHGANLEGQRDWKSPLPSGRMPAPPHDASGHTWHHPDDVLFASPRKARRR